MKIAFLTAGVIAPCLSSSIRALIQNYNRVLPNSEMFGYLNGYRGLLLGKSIEFPDTVKNKYEIPVKPKNISKYLATYIF